MFLFNNLPPELRARIWEFTVEPRTVEIDITERDWVEEKRGYRLYSTTPVPGPLQTCREARSLGLYKQAFSEACSQQRYVWVNLDIDMISIGSKTHLSFFGPIAPLIKRLKFQREHQDEWWFRDESKLVRTFINVEEIHVICDAWCNWWGASEDIRWPCAMENVLLFDEEDDGPAMNPIELDKMWYDRQEVEERELQAEYDEDTRLELADMVPL